MAWRSFRMRPVVGNSVETKRIPTAPRAVRQREDDVPSREQVSVDSLAPASPT